MERQPLIKIDDLRSPENKGSFKHLVSDHQATGLDIFQRSRDFGQRIGQLQPNLSYHFYCRGDWGLHDLVIYLAGQIGSCSLYFCTWSIGNEAIVKLNECRRQGVFSSIWAIFSTRVRHNHPDMYNSACNAFDRVVLDELHAKVAVLENSNWTISVFGSSNMTSNPRIERNSIITDKTVALADKDFLVSIIEEKYDTH